MKIQIEFDIEGGKQDLDNFLGYLSGEDRIVWEIKKYPKKYKKIVEEYI